MKKLLATAAIIAASLIPGVQHAEATSWTCYNISGHGSTCRKSDNNVYLEFTHHDRCRGASGDFNTYGTWKVLSTSNTTAYGPGCPPKTYTLYHGGIVR